MPPHITALSLILLILGMLQKAQGAPPTAADCMSLSPSAVTTSSAVDGVTLLQGDKQLAAPFVFEDGGSIILTGGVNMVQLDASQLTEPVIQVSGGSTVCLHNLHITGSPTTVIQASGASRILLNTVNITKSSLASSLSLVDVADSSLEVLNSTLTDNLMQTGKHHLFAITGSSTTTIASSLISNNILSSSSTLINILFSDDVTTLSMSDATRVSNNTAGRLLYAAAQSQDASTLMGLERKNAIKATKLLSHAEVLELFKGNTTTDEDASSLMEHIANRASSVLLRDTVFTQNTVVLEMMGLYRVHMQLHNVELSNNTGVGIPASGVRTGRTCCMQLESSMTSYPDFMPASWRGAVFSKAAWNDTVECKTKQPVVLTTASRQPPMTNSADARRGRGPIGPDCTVPVGSRVSSHMLYAYNGTLWLNNSVISNNNFTFGSLVETSNLTSTVIQSSWVQGNTAQTMVNVSGVTVFLDKEKYENSRFEDEWTRDLTIPTDENSFFTNDRKLASITDDLMMVMRSATVYMQASSFVNNTLYSAVLRAWGTRSGQYNNLSSYTEDSSFWYLQDSVLAGNKVHDIGQHRENTRGQWTTPSIISWIHTNATMDNVTISNNEAVRIVNIETCSITVLNSVLQNNSLLPIPEPVFGFVWFTKWATLGFQNTRFEANCPAATNTTLVFLDSVHTYLIGTQFISNAMSPSSSSLMNSSAYTQLTMLQCEFTHNEAEKLLYTFGTRHVITTQVRFSNNTGTCMYLDEPKNVFEDSEYSRTNLTRLMFSGNTGGAYGVMYVALNPGASLAVYDQSAFTDNQGAMGGALVCQQQQPTDANAAMVTVNGSTFARNMALQHGGAITILGGSLTVLDTEIANNTAAGTGGGIYADVSSYQLTNVRVVGNTAQSAAGMALVTQTGLDGGPAGSVVMSSIKDSTVSSNYINFDSQKLVSPAVLNCGLGGAGGLCLVSPAANLSDVTNTTISDNRAIFGGALFIDCGVRPVAKCGTEIIQTPTAVMRGNTARKPSSDIAMLSSKSCLRVKCATTSTEVYSAEELGSVPQPDCPGWQGPQQTQQNMSSTGISTQPTSMACALSGLQLQFQDGSYQIISGSTWNATIALQDEDGHDVVDMLDDIVIKATPREEDLIMITGNHPGEVNGTLSANSTDGQFILSNIIAWPSQSDPNNNQYHINFKAESSHSRFPIKVAEMQVVLPRCTLGEYLISSIHTCQTCRDLNSTRPLFSLHPKQRCEPCPEKGYCSHKHGMLLPTPDYFQPSFLLPQIVRCPIPEACQHSLLLENQIIAWKEELRRMNATSAAAAFNQWLKSGNGSANGTGYWEKNELFRKLQCSPGYQGLLCGACAEHHGRYFGHCQRCLPTWVNTVILLLIVAGVFGIVALLTSGHMRKTLRKYAGKMHGVTFVGPKNPRTREAFINMPTSSKARASCFACLNLPQNLSVQSFEKISHIFKVLTTFVQVNAITRGLSWVAPRQVRQYFTHVDFTSSPGAWISLDCSLQHLGLDNEQVAIARSIFLILLPVFCLLGAYTTWMLCFLWRVKRKQLPRHSWKKYIIPRLWLSTVQTCYILYPVVTINIFDIFTCDPLDPPQDGMEENYRNLYNVTLTGVDTPVWQDKRLWTQNHETVCNTGRHAALMWALGVPALLIFAVGVPVGLVVVLLTHRHQLQEPKTELQFGFLYEEYKQRFSYWEAVIMARKVALLVIIIALPYIRSMYRQFVQVSSCVVVMMICLLLHVTYQPFTDPLLNRLDGISILMTIVNLYMITYWMIPDMSHAIQLLVMVTMLFLNTLVILYFLYHLLSQLKDHAQLVSNKVCGPQGCCSCLRGTVRDTGGDDGPDAHGLNGDNTDADVEEAAEKSPNTGYSSSQRNPRVMDTQALSDRGSHNLEVSQDPAHTQQDYTRSLGHRGADRAGDTTPRIEVPPPPASRQSTSLSSPSRSMYGHSAASNTVRGVYMSSTGHSPTMTTYKYEGPYSQQLTQHQHQAQVAPSRSQTYDTTLPHNVLPPDSHNSAPAAAVGGTVSAFSLGNGSSGRYEDMHSGYSWGTDAGADLGMIAGSHPAADFRHDSRPATPQTPSADAHSMYVLGRHQRVGDAVPSPHSPGPLGATSQHRFASRGLHEQFDAQQAENGLRYSKIVVRAEPEESEVNGYPAAEAASHRRGAAGHASTQNGSSYMATISNQSSPVLPVRPVVPTAYVAGLQQAEASYPSAETWQQDRHHRDIPRPADQTPQHSEQFDSDGFRML